tara:strand:+ start:1218 stop:1709 length:492 start_codon:yes stop_codon:yes gene_type:complete
MQLFTPSHNMQKHFTFLYKKALCSRSATSKHSCGIVSGGRIIYFAVNQPWRNMVDGQRIGCFHSEAAALRKCVQSEKKGKTCTHVRRKMKRKSLIVVRANLNNANEQAYSMSAPCRDCIRYIRKCGISKIYFSTNDDRSRIAKVNARDFKNDHVSWGRRVFKT